MAEFQFNCPQCGVLVTAEDSVSGEAAECPNCGKGIVIPHQAPRRLGIHRSRSADALHSPLAQTCQSPVPDLPPSVNPAESVSPRFQQLEREVAEEKRRAVIVKVGTFAKNMILLLVLLAVGYFGWTMFSGKFKTSPSEESKQITEKKFDFDSCRDKLVVIGNDGMRSGGSGFLVRMGTKKYFVTNEHVARGPEKWFERVCLIDGCELKLGKFEVAVDQDLVRFEIDEQLPAFEQSEATPKMNEEINIFGNSSGGGAATAITGNIKAVGPFRLEVDAEAVAGNSGSPVLNGEGEVVGVFTYVTNDRNDQDWGKEGTRFNGVRRWAVRFKDLKWITVDWHEYRRQVAGLSDVVNYMRRLLPFVAVSNEEYEKSAFTYGLKYGDREEAIFNTYEDVFRRHLVNLSSQYDSIRESGAWTGDRGGRRPRKKDEIKFAEALRVALESAIRVLDDTKWVAPQFKSDMTDFCPMAWYRDLLDKVIAARTRRLNELSKDGRGGMEAVYDEVKDCLGLVQAGDGRGSGFIAKLDGRKYFITNEHVVRGGNPFSVRTPSGVLLKFKSFEVAENEDLVRMELGDDSLDALDIRPDDPAVGTSIYVFGNSDGGGVITHESGSVMAVGPDRLEVKASFVQGNSGSAVLNDTCEVIGVATYATLRNDPENWVKEGTRYNGVRRFAVRLSHVKWKKMPWKEYVEFASAVEECERYVNLCREVCFRGQKLLHGYEIKEMIGDGKVKQGTFVMALTAVGRADDSYTSLLDLYEKLQSKASVTKKGALEDPRDKIRRVVRNYPVTRQKCMQNRLSVLKTGLQFVNGLKIQTAWQEERVRPLRRFFEYHVRRFKEFFKDDLLGPTRLTMP